MGRLNKFLFLAGVAFYILDPPTGLAYNDQTTHPALTDEIVDFYNLVFSNNPLTSEEKEWIITGSINEDVIPRMMNHFYDPVTSQGWTGELAGSVSVDALRKIAEMGSGFTPFPATQWATDYLTQQGYSLYGGNHSWKRGLDEYAEGKRMEAFITLGHALHLLEDMGVPDHTRNDTHVDAVEGITGDEGSPYEQYASRWNRTTIEALGLPGKINAATESVPNKSKVEDYLVSLAQYSSKYFFSKDTINDLKYASPRIVRMDENFGYGIDEADKEFLLVKHITYKNGLRYTEEYVLDKNSDPIFDAYFARLSRQILLHGVGVVNLFLKQAEDVKVNLEYQKASNPLYFAVVKPTGDVVSAAKFSPAGFFSNMYSSFSFALNSLANGFSRSLGFVNSLLGQGENPRLAKETVGTPEQINIENEFIQKSIDRVNRGFDMATITPQVESSASSAINTKLSESGLTEKEQVLTPNSPVEQLENESNAGPQEGDIPTPIFPPGGGGGSGPAGEMAIGDNSPPEAVVSLVASGAASSSLTLNWTAPADAGVAIASYEIVYATTTITEDNWANGRAVPPPTPLAPGTSQEILISGLSPNTTYYFAIRSRDSVGNESAISNVVSTTTLSASKVSNVNHVLISEMQVSGSAGAGDEFIELYNPTDGEENISNWSIQYLSGEATSTA